ncbi:hypothetical protein AAW51_2841 [Caldimonas brevitalea]|uniref:Aminodeoxychorismate lyase n=1 Tax=Caldimonas brevitalea TaxID=413882 RepID=A0A0G3BJH6_9BURK|nr:hypothetical protein AAW51_2841 [Caldimonas brevitalea]
MRFLKRLFGALVLLALLSVVLSGAAAYWWLQQPLPLKSASVEFSVEAGMTPRQIANGWVAAGIDTPALVLYEWFRWSGQARKIRAGSYEVGAGTTPRALLQKMVLGDQTLATVRLIEGWTFRQWRAELARTQTLRSTITAMSDEQVMEALGAPGQHPEDGFSPIPMPTAAAAATSQC